MATLWAVPRDWQGQTVVVLASGPSMSREVAEKVRGKCRVIAVSNQGIPNTLKSGEVVPAFAPWADVLYAGDEKWWRTHLAHALKFEGLKVTAGSVPNGGDHILSEYPQVLTLITSGRMGFDERPTHLRTGGNSGYQAIHLAAHRGAARILLCGFDMRGTHWFGTHPKPLNQRNVYRRWIEAYQSLAVELKGRGIEVLNCTPGSALKCFRMARLRDVLA